MATTKTLSPTNQTITIDAFQGEKPDHRHVADAETKLADAVNALNSQLAYEVETPASFDTNNLTYVVGLRRSNISQVNITIKAGLAASWHNDIVTGLSARFRPATAVYGCHRVNASADLSKDIIAILNTNGTIQMLNGAVFDADIPFSFTFVTAS